MKVSMRYNALAIACCLLVLSAGCANHIRDIDETTNEIQREVANSQYSIKLSEDPPNSSMFGVVVEKTEKMNVKNYQVNKKSELCTPYQGWRKTYEMPAGLCLLPVSLMTHVMFVFTFGMLPYSVPSAVNTLAFDGMNPFMNFESESRAETIPLSVDRKMIDEHMETVTQPVAKEKVSVKSGERTFPFVTDEYGKFNVYLISPDNSKSVFSASRELQIFVDAVPNQMKDVAISRELQSKLVKGRALMAEYASAPTGKNLAKCVMGLEKLNFKKLAYEVEKAELEKHKSESAFARDFADSVSE